MKSHDIAGSFDGLAEVEFKTLAAFNEGSIGVFWASSGVSPWELHPDDDEFLQIVEGSVDIEVLGDDGGEIVSLEAGSMFVVPRGHWHRHRHRGPVKELYLTPGRTEMSFESDPRAGR